MSTLQSPYQDSDKHDHGENILKPSLKLHFETRALRYVITNYSKTVRNNLARRNDFNNDFIDEALDEWHDMALCPNRALETGERFQFSKILEEIKQNFVGDNAVIKIHKLSSDASWNDIILDGISNFDEPIKMGIKHDWPWDRVLQLYNDALYIDIALKVGLDPSTDYSLVEQAIMQKQFEADSVTQVIVNGNVLYAADFIRRRGLPENTTMASLQDIVFKIKRDELAQIENGPVENISIWDVLNYYHKQ